MRDIKQRHSKGLDVPRWLCSGGLGSAALHEAAYLEHCRQYALGKTPRERQVKAVQFCNPATEPSPTRCKPGDYSQNKTSFTHELSQDSIKPVKIGQQFQLVAAVLVLAFKRRTYGKHKNLEFGDNRRALSTERCRWKQSQQIRCFLARSLGGWLCNSRPIAYSAGSRHGPRLCLCVGLVIRACRPPKWRGRNSLVHPYPVHQRIDGWLSGRAPQNKVDRYS